MAWLHKYRYAGSSILSPMQKKWLNMFTEDEFNTLCMNVIPLDIILNTKKMTIPCCLEYIMRAQGYIIR